MKLKDLHRAMLDALGLHNEPLLFSTQDNERQSSQEEDEILEEQDAIEETSFINNDINSSSNNNNNNNEAVAKVQKEKEEEEKEEDGVEEEKKEGTANNASDDDLFADDGDMSDSGFCRADNDEEENFKSPETKRCKRDEKEEKMNQESEEELCEYDKIRLRNIEQRKKMFEELQILQSKVSPFPPVSVLVKKRRRRRRMKEIYQGKERRKSMRIQDVRARNDDDDDDDEPGRVEKVRGRRCTDSEAAFTTKFQSPFDSDTPNWTRLSTDKFDCDICRRKSYDCQRGLSVHRHHCKKVNSPRSRCDTRSGQNNNNDNNNDDNNNNDNYNDNDKGNDALSLFIIAATGLASPKSGHDYDAAPLEEEEEEEASSYVDVSATTNESPGTSNSGDPMQILERYIQGEYRKEMKLLVEDYRQLTEYVKKREDKEDVFSSVRDFIVFELLLCTGGLKSEDICSVVDGEWLKCEEDDDKMITITSKKDKNGQNPAKLVFPSHFRTWIDNYVDIVRPEILRTNPEWYDGGRGLLNSELPLFLTEKGFVDLESVCEEVQRRIIVDKMIVSYDSLVKVMADWSVNKSCPDEIVPAEIAGHVEMKENSF